MERGGGHIANGMYFSWPFVRLEIEEEGITFSAPFARWFLPKDEIQEVTACWVVLARGVRFEHRVADTPTLTFFSLRPRRLYKRLAERGYPVQGAVGRAVAS